MSERTPRARRWARSLALPALLLVAAPAMPLVAAPAAAGEAVWSGLAAAPAAQVAAVCAPAPVPGRPVEQVPWPLARYDLVAAHRVAQGAGVTVAVLDSGVDSAHPQLAGAVRGGGDALSGSGDGLEDCVGHGTAVASIIAARPSDGIAFRGLAPAATILSIRVGDRRVTEDGYAGTGDVGALVSGIYAAAAAQPRPAVLNLSISTTTDSPALRDAIQAALDADIVVVAAVGNRYDQGNPTPYPAAYDGVVGVGAVDHTGVRYRPSQVGEYVDLVAPGDDVLAAAPLAGHVAQSGTSFAVPFVAGTAALIRERWPELDRNGVVRRLLATADPPSGGQPSPDYGHGIVNPLRAVTEVIPPAPPPRTAPASGPVLSIGVATGATDGVPPTRVLAIAGALLAGTAGVAILAVVVPAARRRGWRPGRIQPMPPPPEDGSVLFEQSR